MDFIWKIVIGLTALALILGIYCLGRSLRTGLEESEWYDDEF